MLPSNRPVAITMKKESFAHKYFGVKRVWQLYLMALIPVTFILVFAYFPMGGVMIAFKDFSIRKGIMGSPWAGFKYFQQLFNTPIFFDIVKNTITISLY